uniref:Vacuolar protein-sorting-associated protein 25 n=1 Tax=Orthoderella ornata TaxID=444751 RepID=A0A481SWS7_9NEOP|nr:hypothetical protein [Orthoderella ornata]
MAAVEWPWQYSFPPFFTIQPHNETRAKQIAAWRSLVLDYYRATKQSTLDVAEAQRSELFNNSSIKRKLPQEGIIMILEDLARTGNAEALDKQKRRWLVYWHTLDEWANILYSWAQNSGMTNTVCTFYELVEGDSTADEDFHGLDTEVLVKALQKLEGRGKAEVIMFDDNQGVKFF